MEAIYLVFDKEELGSRGVVFRRRCLRCDPFVQFVELKRGDATDLRGRVIVLRQRHKAIENNRIYRALNRAFIASVFARSWMTFPCGGKQIGHQLVKTGIAGIERVILDHALGAFGLEEQARDDFRNGFRGSERVECR